MTFAKHEKLPSLLVLAFFLLGICYTDWGHFFPISTHSDLRFQIIGECIEVLAIAGISVFSYYFFRVMRKNKFDGLNIEKQIAAVGVFSLLNLAFSWRTFFPGDHFNFHSVTTDILDSVFIGIIIVSLSSATNAFAHKPDKEEETSAAERMHP